MRPFLILFLCMCIVSCGLLKKKEEEETTKSDANLGKIDASCDVGDMSLALPIAGTANKDWVIVNHVDLDSRSSKLKDYYGTTGKNTKTYNAHLGTDIDISGFRAMDSDVPVLASADGVVVGVTDGESDRNMIFSSSCKLTPNLVTIRHDNSFTTTYMHFKKDSIIVSEGETVTKGQKLGLVGSSGCSSQPHIHLELRDCSGKMVEPMLYDLMESVPEYDVPLTYWDYSLHKKEVTSIDEVKDPGDNPTSLTLNQKSTIALNLLGGTGIITLEIYNPSGTKVETFERTVDVNYRHSWWYWYFTPNASGQWKANVTIDGVLQKEITFTVQ